MKKFYKITTGKLLFFVLLNISYAQKADDIKQEEIVYQPTTSYFLINKGQWPDEQILLTCKQKDLHTQITTNGFRIHQFQFKRNIYNQSSKFDLENFKDWSIKGDVLNFIHINSNFKKENIQIIKQETSEINFIKKGQNNDIAYYKQLHPLTDFIIKDIYPGIDQRWYFDEGHQRFDYIIHPGADLSQLQIVLQGATEVTKEKNHLKVKTSVGSIELKDLKAYQLTDGKNRDVAIQWNIRKSENQTLLSFQAGNYQNDVDLIIDPTIWGTYIGGNTANMETYTGVKVREFLHIAYTTGYAFDIDFPTTPGAYQTNSDGSTLTADVIVTRFLSGAMSNSVANNYINYGASNQLLSSTYITGTGIDAGLSIDIEQLTQRVFIGGATTSTDFPVTTNNIQSSHTSPLASFILEMDSTLSLLNYSTYLSGSGEDQINDIKFKNGEVYFAGTTSSNDLQIAGNAFQTTYQGGAYDGFYGIINTSTNQLILCSYYGGNNYDAINGIDVNNNLYIALGGETESTNIPMATNTVYSSNAGQREGFMAVMDYLSNNYLFSSYYGGAGNDHIYDIRFKGDSLFIGGSTGSDDIPMINAINGYYQNDVELSNTRVGSKEGLIAVFVWNGTPSLVYSNFMRFGSVALQDPNYEVFITAVDVIGVHNFGFAGYLILNNPSIDEVGFCGKLSYDLTYLFRSVIVGANPGYRDFVYDMDGTWDSECYLVGYSFDPNMFQNIFSGDNNYYINGTTNGISDAFISRYLTGQINIFPIPSISPYLNCNNPTLNINYNIQSPYSGTIFSNSNIHQWADLVNYGAINITVDTSMCDYSNSFLNYNGYINIHFIYSYHDNLTRIGVYPILCNTQPPIFYITPSNPKLICNQSSVELSAVLDPNYQQLHPMNISWSNNTYTAITQATQPGWYSVTMTDLLNGCSDSDSVLVVADTIKPQLFINNLSMTDTLNCNITQISLEAVVDTVVNYNWSSGEITQQINVALPGSYGVIVTNPGNNCTATQNINIYQNLTPPNPSIITNNNLFELNCSNPTITAEANGGKFYQWSNGVVDSLNTISTPGIYTVTVTGDNGCTSTTNVIISSDFSLPPANILSLDGNYTLTCKKTEIALLAQQGVSYTWQPPVSNSVIAYITEPGTYTVTVTGANGCTASTSIMILENMVPVNLNWVDTIRPDCGKYNGMLTVQATGGTPPYTYTWNTTLSNVNQLTNLPNGYYWVYVYDSEGCKDTLEIDFYCKQENNNGGNDTIGPITIIPQLITPNNDGNNDTWEIPNIEDYPNNKVIIMNRWGDKIFEASPYQNNWAGQSNTGMVVGGNKVTSGVYFYVIDLGNNTSPLKGYVVLEN